MNGTKGRSQPYPQPRHRSRAASGWLARELGTGYRRVTEDCRAGGYPAPEWEERGPALRVVFRPHPEVAAAADETIDVSVNVPINVP